MWFCILFLQPNNLISKVMFKLISSDFNKNLRIFSLIY